MIETGTSYEETEFSGLPHEQRERLSAGAAGGGGEGCAASGRGLEGGPCQQRRGYPKPATAALHSGNGGFASRCHCVRAGGGNRVSAGGSRRGGRGYWLGRAEPRGRLSASASAGLPRARLFP